MSLLDVIIPQAMATTAAGGQQPQSMSSLFVMLAVIIAMMYFLIWRPQSKRSKDHKDLVTALAVGDEVITSGGVFGKITQVEEQFFRVEVAEGTVIKLQKSAVTTALPKGTL